MKNVIEENSESQQKSNCEEHFCEWPILNNWGERTDQNKFPNGNPLQYSCLETPMEGGPWWAPVHGVATSLTRLRDFPFTFHFHALEKEMATHSSVLAWRTPGTGGTWWAAISIDGMGHTESDTTEVT